MFVIYTYNHFSIELTFDVQHVLLHLLDWVSFQKKSKDLDSQCHLLLLPCKPAIAAVCIVHL